MKNESLTPRLKPNLSFPPMQILYFCLILKGLNKCVVAERIWSPDQKIIKKGKGKVRLILNASSEPELTTWLLSFGDEARLLKPEYLQKKRSKISQTRFRIIIPDFERSFYCPLD
ncbi:MAG: WYL domain-containing protein [Thermodesulfobacteriota bacterium]|nr:WYL domain-containing protein [Thermodesulfobacteriota bacterium]